MTILDYGGVFTSFYLVYVYYAVGPNDSVATRVV